MCNRSPMVKQSTLWRALALDRTIEVCRRAVRRFDVSNVDWCDRILAPRLDNLLYRSLLHVYNGQISSLSEVGILAFLRNVDGLASRMSTDRSLRHAICDPSYFLRPIRPKHYHSVCLVYMILWGYPSWCHAGCLVGHSPRQTTRLVLFVYLSGTLTRTDLFRVPFKVVLSA